MTHSYQTTITSNLVPWHGLTPQEAYMRGVMDEQASRLARHDARKASYRDHVLRRGEIREQEATDE